MANYIEELEKFKPKITQLVQKAQKDFLDELYSTDIVFTGDKHVNNHFVDTYNQYHHDLDSIVLDHSLRFEHHSVRELMKFSIRHYMSKIPFDYPTILREYLSKKLIEK